MTPFAGYAQNKCLVVVEIRIRVGDLRLEIPGVTFEAPRDDPAIKARTPVLITGAVDPAPRQRRITYGQLEQLTLIPEQIRLAVSARPNHEIKSLGVRPLVRRSSPDRGLKKLVVFGAHAETQIRIAGLHDIGVGAKAAQNRVLVGRLRGQMMGGFVVTSDYFLMASGTGGIPDIIAAPRCAFVCCGPWRCDDVFTPVCRREPLMRRNGSRRE